MADIKKPKVDVVVVGLGWTGALTAMELTTAGLNVVALERGGDRDTKPDFSYPRIADELEYASRYRLFQDFSKETCTLRHSSSETALPYRAYGAFLPGDGVGGAGSHWNGMLYRSLPEELNLRSFVTEKFGASLIPEDMTIQDYGVTYDELEPFYDKFEAICGTSGSAGVINGKVTGKGNPFEGSRSRDYPLPPLKDNVAQQLFAKAAKEVGFHPYAAPAAHTSEVFTNPYGMQMGPCTYCGYCERFGCYNYSKASPNVCVMPALRLRNNFELRTHSHVTKVNLDNTKKKATGVTYIDAQGRTVEQPADLVVLCAYQLHNVRLLMLSGIGEQYDPATGKGTVGKNYAYQVGAGYTLFYDSNTQINPFMGTGAAGQAFDDLNTGQLDMGKIGAIGGSVVRLNLTGGRPIGQMHLPPGAPKWGSGWKKAIKDNYLTSVSFGISTSSMAYRDCYLDLDPTYKDDHGLPLLRMTFNLNDNDLKVAQDAVKQTKKVAEAMNAKQYVGAAKPLGSKFDLRPYQSTHNTGGAIMGESPESSVVNKYLQSWDVPNVFVMGACAFPQNRAYNPTGPLAALTLWSLHHITTQYLKNPGALLQA